MLPFIEFPSFDDAVDEFFSKLESQKLDAKTAADERAALSRLDQFRQDHERRLGDLQQSQDHMRLQASLVEANVDVVSVMEHPAQSPFERFVCA